MWLLCEDIFFDFLSLFCFDAETDCFKVRIFLLSYEEKSLFEVEDYVSENDYLLLFEFSSSLSLFLLFFKEGEEDVDEFF